MPADARGRTERSFPTRLFVAGIWLVCLALTVSAAFTAATLFRLRTQYLTNLGHEISGAIEAQARGQGRRNNPQFWQSLLEESYQAFPDSLAFLALVDQAGGVLAAKGAPSVSPMEFSGNGDAGIFVFEMPLVPPRLPHAGTSPQIQGWRLRVGLYTSQADFIRKQTLMHLAVSGVAIVALLAVAYSLLRTLRRFLALKAREGAEAHLKALGTMAASLAHEIRNPLGAMKGLSQLAQEDLPPDHAAQARLRTVVNESERLERLVSGLLDFARPKQPQISGFDVTKLLAAVRDTLQPELHSAGVSLELLLPDGPLRIESDQGGLRQILLNVLLNAVDAAPRGGVVRLGAGQGLRDGILWIHIDDTGPGLGARDPEELFQPFVTTKARGTGLGLAVSRQIAESLGGSLTLSNGPEGGARCSIQLPIAAK